MLILVIKIVLIDVSVHDTYLFLWPANAHFSVSEQSFYTHKNTCLGVIM